MNHFIPTPDFFTTFFHSYSLNHGAVVLFLFHLPSELEFFFQFLSKNDWIFFLNWFFFSIKWNPGGYHPNCWVEGAPSFISKLFDEVLIIAFSKVIHNKPKKSHIFRHVFWHSFSHILRTTSPSLLIFIPHILELVYCVLEQTSYFYHH